MKVGYARVSTDDQSLSLQLDALKEAGCGRVFEEKASGKSADRPVLAECLSFLREGDELVVWRLDRLGRSIQDLIAIVKGLRERKVEFRSLRESLDTTTSGGKLIFHFFAALAEFERDVIRERTMAGLTAARARGRIGGRKPCLDAAGADMLRKVAKDKNIPVDQICAQFKIGRSSFFKYLTANGPTPTPTYLSPSATM
jgi:DNA invertase Pin-like site-specific DNA recombinase